MQRSFMGCQRIIPALLTATMVLLSSIAVAQEKEAESKVKVLKARGGLLTFEVPATWKTKPKRSSMLEFEFSAPAAAKADEPTARITMMASGGSIKANIDRWIGQFKQPDGGSTRDRAKITEFKADGLTVHWADITGTFEESMGGGPFAPGKKVTRNDHRMIGAIVIAGRVQYFVKMTGPAKVCEKLSEDFKKMIEGLDHNG